MKNKHCPNCSGYKFCVLPKNCTLEEFNEYWRPLGCICKK